MLTPVSSIGTPTITLEGGDPSGPIVQTISKELGLKSATPVPGEGISESPLPQGPPHSTPPPKLPKVDSGGGTETAAQTLLKLLPETFEPGVSATAPPRNPIPKSQVKRRLLFSLLCQHFVFCFFFPSSSQ